MDMPSARAFIVGLLIECPYGLDTRSCILSDYRKKSLKEKLELSKQLTEEKVKNIIATHKYCLLKNEGKSSSDEKESIIGD
jgi:hypothetical protein